jgi:hypothetical protein
VGTPPVTTVKIVINGTSYKVPPGSHTVAYLKEVGGVPACDELSQVVSGKIVPLQDGGTVEIHGAETFLANPRSCPSS